MVALRNVFSTEYIHRITEANINFYAAPFLHPKRKMKEHDFIYLLQGEWKFGQNDEVYILKKDSLLILSAENIHYGIAPCSAGTKTMYFHATCERGDRSYVNGDKTSENSPVIDSFVDASANKNIKNYFSRVVNCKLSGNQRKADLYFELLLCELADNNTYSADYEVAERIEKIIHKNPESFIGNKELADMVNVSVKTAETKFKQRFGITIHQYILKYKINEAISYFETFPQISIKEIALNLGFYDEYHFSKQFKRITGISPAVYRKMQNQ